MRSHTLINTNLLTQSDVRDRIIPACKLVNYVGWWHIIHALHNIDTAS